MTLTDWLVLSGVLLLLCSGLAGLAWLTSQWRRLLRRRRVRRAIRTREVYDIAAQRRKQLNAIARIF